MHTGIGKKWRAKSVPTYNYSNVDDATTKGMYACVSITQAERKLVDEH